MSAHAAPSWRPRYDPHETLDQFTVRQRRAYAAFEVAWREARVSVKLKGYYDQLVRAVGTNAYAWWSEAAWAEEFGVSVSTIKRVLAALVKAGLIRRERQFAGSSHTYITAYDPVTAALDITEELQASSGVAVPTGVREDRNTDNHYSRSQIDESNDYQQSSTPSFGSTSEPTFGSVVASDSFKRQHLSSVSGASNLGRPTSQTVQAILEREGVSDFLLAPRLQQLDWAELHAVQRYLNGQRNVQDRPRLFAWLAVHGFGAQLLQGGHRRDQRKRAPSAAVDPLRYITGPLASLLHGQAPEGPRADEHPAPGEAASSAPPAPGLSAPPPWGDVLARLRAHCAPSEWATWLEPTALLQLTDTTVVVGTPNVFVRDALRERYLPLLQVAVEACCGSPRTIEVVIGSA